MPTPEPPPQNSYQRGLEKLRERDGKAALAEFNACLKEIPGHVGCTWERGWAQFLEFEFESALSDWRQAAQLSSDLPRLEQTLSRGEIHAALWKLAQSARKKMKVRRYEKPNRPPEAGVLRLWAMGDTMLGSDFPTAIDLPPEGENPLAQFQEDLRAVAPKSAPHLRFMNYEGTLCDGGVTEKCAAGSKTCYAFRTPPRFADYLRDFQVTAASLANNHALDFGDDCRAQTEAALSERGIGLSGRPGTFWTGQVSGVGKTARPVLFAAFHSSPAYNSTLELTAAREWVAKLRQDNPKALIAVSFHGGAEGVEAVHTPREMELFHGEKRGDVRAFAHAVVDAGADVVLGSGPHVLRGMEIYKRRLIAYSLGNFATVKTFNLSGFNGVSVLLEADIDPKGRFLRGRLHPTIQTQYGVVRYDLRARGVDLVRILSQMDFGAHAPKIARDGSFRP